MIRRYLAGIMFAVLFFSTAVFAQDSDLQSSVDRKIDKMKNALHLTDAQVVAVQPILKDYMSKRMAILQEVAGEGLIDHVSIKATLKALKEDEYRRLSKVLTEDQLQEWINKENLMASLNPDGGESLVDDDGPTLGANGANFKF